MSLSPLNRLPIGLPAQRVAAPKLIGQNKDEVTALTPARLAELGYKVMTYPADGQLAAIHAMRAVYRHLKEHGTSIDYTDMVTFAERDEIVGAPAYRAALRRFLP